MQQCLKILLNRAWNSKFQTWLNCLDISLESGLQTYLRLTGDLLETCKTMTWSHLWVQQMDQWILTVWFKLHHAHHQNKPIHMVLLTCYYAAIMTEGKRLHAPSYSLKVLIICCETHCFSLLLHIRWSGKFRFTSKAFIRVICRSMCT